jgi:hypothetical protein
MDYIGNKTTKIPTLLGLSLLITALILGIFIFFYRQNLLHQQRTLYAPKELNVTNLFAEQVTITWWSDTPTTGQVAYGTNVSLNDIQNDNRDLQEIKTHHVHFVTLRNLKPDTTYKYQIIANGIRFPEKPLTFKTAIALENSTQNRPLRGSVLNVNLNPIDEALLTIKIDGAADMSTFASTAGNFIFPLKELRTTDLTAPFAIESTTPATLIIKKGSLESQVKLNLPLNESDLLPPLTIGQNIDLSSILTQMTEPPQTSQSANYDLNGDGKTNSLDLAIITQNNGKKVTDIQDDSIKKADLNKDETIDKKDSDLLLTTL